MNKGNYYFTSESVSEGHPDKVCDKISDSILDEYLTRDPNSRVAIETMATTNLIIIAGEVKSLGKIKTNEIEAIARKTVKGIGYNLEDFNWEDVEIRIYIHDQSPDIAMGVDSKDDNKSEGAGDQGIMFGYACKETPELMPMPIYLAHRLTERLSKLRKDGTLPWLGPDGKSQVSVDYINGKPASISKIVIATQHDDMLDKFDTEEMEHNFVEEEVIEKVIKPVLEKSGLESSGGFIVNGTGRFVFGGPDADTGLTGRKIIVDTYGGYAPHGGGAFSGKDPSKVDRSAAYMARYIAKNIVAADLADNCEVQFSYSIGVAEPTSFYVKSFNTGKISDEELTNLAKEIFPLKPGDIISHLELKYPRYRQTASYGHFGREDDLFTWERVDMVDKLKSAFNERNI